MKIEIKERKLTAGNRSLYLEYYETGFRKKENLHLYLVPENSPKAKKLNRETYDKARVIRAERLLNPPSFEKKSKQTEGKNEKAEALTWLDWCDEYIQWSKACDNCKKMLQHKGVVRKRIATYLERIKQTKILLKNVDQIRVRCCFYCKKFLESFVPGESLFQSFCILTDSLLIIKMERCRIFFGNLVEFLKCHKWYFFHNNCISCFPTAVP